MAKIIHLALAASNYSGLLGGGRLLPLKPHQIVAGNSYAGIALLKTGVDPDQRICPQDQLQAGTG
jgi:hypothetical protein